MSQTNSVTPATVMSKSTDVQSECAGSALNQGDLAVVEALLTLQVAKPQGKIRRRAQSDPGEEESDTKKPRVPHVSRGGGAPRQNGKERPKLEIHLDEVGNPRYKPSEFFQVRIDWVKTIAENDGVTKKPLPDKVDAYDKPQVHPYFGFYAIIVDTNTFDGIAEVNANGKKRKGTPPKDPHESRSKMWNMLGFCIQTLGEGQYQLTYSQGTFKTNGWRIQENHGNETPDITFVESSASTSD